MTFPNKGRTGALLLGALLLSSCGSLLGSGKRADLFRFGIAERKPVSGAQSAVPARSISLLRPRFSQEIEGDRILTTRGERALYVKGARWVAPVPDLFSQALTRQFAARAPGVRLTGARNATGATQALQISIARFEARYNQDFSERTPPTVVIEGDATIFDLTDRHPVASGNFSVEEPASANTTSAIVAAFDRAVARYIAALGDWTIRTGESNTPGEGRRSEWNEGRKGEL